MYFNLIILPQKPMSIHREYLVDTFCNNTIKKQHSSKEQINRRGIKYSIPYRRKKKSKECDFCKKDSSNFVKIYIDKYNYTVLYSNYQASYKV